MDETTKLLLELIENCIKKNKRLEKRIEILEGRKCMCEQKYRSLEKPKPAFIPAGLQETLKNNPDWFCKDGGIHEYDGNSQEFPPKCLKCGEPANITLSPKGGE